MHAKIGKRPMSKLYKRNGMYYIRFRKNRGEKFTYRSLHTRNKETAQRKRARIDRALSAQLLLAHAERPVALTLAQLSEHYTAWANERRRPATVSGTVSEIERFQKITGIQFISQISRQHVEQFQRKFRASGASPRTVNKSLRTLRAAVNVAIRLEIYDRQNPFAKFELLSVTKTIPKFLSIEQMHNVLDEAEKHGPDAHLIFALGIYAGLRKEEILAARWEWIDFANRTLYVRGSETFIIKDKEERAIDLNSTLAAILTRYRTSDGGYIVRPENEPSINRYRFEMKKTFDAVTKRANVEWCTAKLLRYTFASQLVSNGAPLYYVQRQLGHSSPVTTMIYAHLAPNKDMIELIPARPKTTIAETITTTRNRSPKRRAPGANPRPPASKSPAPTQRE